MRIISGRWKGRTIPPPPTPRTRPSTDLWRTTMFNVLDNHIDWEGARVMDLYAGTGSLGLECLSRGASYCTFVENHGPTCKGIQTMLQELDATSMANVVCADVVAFIQQMPTSPTESTVQLIVADPPYGLKQANQLVSLLHPRIPADCLVMLEYGTNEVRMPSVQWDVLWSKQKGDTMVEILRPLP
ncbi:MAG: RsmD family RNA methyltransferase [Bradyrhizobiaceae bacterium]|nr:RsmD family RNA methyltransferase [Bradyrhizobiaceae bacterium]